MDPVVTVPNWYMVGVWVRWSLVPQGMIGKGMGLGEAAARSLGLYSRHFLKIIPYAKQCNTYLHIIYILLGSLADPLTPWISLSASHTLGLHAYAAVPGLS